jgi:hypothetical protein
MPLQIGGSAFSSLDEGELFQERLRFDSLNSFPKFMAKQKCRISLALTHVEGID